MFDSGYSVENTGKQPTKRPINRGWLLVAAILVGAGRLAALEPTSVVLSNPPNPSLLGQPVTLTATVTPSTATGKVTFYDGTTLLGTDALVTGQVTLTTSLLSAGPHSLRAYYGGDTKDSPSTSAVVPLTVKALLAGGFQPGQYYSDGGVNTSAIAMGDFNSDGKADLAVANWSSDIVSVFLGNADGTFQPAVNYEAGTDTYSVAVGDFNGDGKPDLAVANGSSNNVSVLLGNGDGTFQKAVYYAAGKGPRFVAVGDFNGDGKADLAVASNAKRTGDNGEVFVLLGRGNGTFEAIPAGSITFSDGFTPLGQDRPCCREYLRQHSQYFAWGRRFGDYLLSTTLTRTMFPARPNWSRRLGHQQRRQPRFRLR